MASAKKYQVQAPAKKRQVYRKWTERETLRFIELYEVEEVLWNVRLSEYKIKDARNAAIERIISNLNMSGLTIQEVNTKINNIRSTYAQEKSKFKKSTGTGSGADDIYVTSLIWFEVADRFLSGVIKSRKTFQNVVDLNECSADIPANPSPDIPASPSPDIPASPSPDIPASPSSDISANTSSTVSTCPSPNVPTTSSDNAQFVVPSNRKLMKKTLPSHITKSIETLQSIKDQALSIRETEDEFCYFAKNIASQLRQLPLLDALDVQSDILNLIKIKRQSTMAPETFILQQEEETIPCTFMLQQEQETTAPESNEEETIPCSFLLQQEEECLVPEANEEEEIIPFILQREEDTIAPETNDSVQEQDNCLLEQAIRSIGGFTETPY